MNWFLWALLPPAMWSISNHIDKYLLSRYFRGGGVGALLIFSSLIGLVIAALIVLFRPDVLNCPHGQALFLVANGCLYIAALLPYFYALKKDEASIVVALFQLVPVYTYFLAWIILKETLTAWQVFGGALILVGAIGIVLEFGENGKKIGFKKEVFWLMSLSSLMVSLNYIFFKMMAIQISFWGASFWEYMGFVVFTIFVLVFIKSYRREFWMVLRQNRAKILIVNGVNETINIVAKIIFNYVSMLMPITLIWVVNCFQPLFVFVYGVILAVYFPHISQEKIHGRYLMQKIIAIVIMFAGSLMLNWR